jgi:hypothetical protein
MSNVCALEQAFVGNIQTCLCEPSSPELMKYRYVAFRPADSPLDCPALCPLYVVVFAGVLVEESVLLSAGPDY